MAFKIEFYSMKQEHITLHPDGSISLWLFKTELSEEIHIKYPQARILKQMILAEEKLSKNNE